MLHRIISILIIAGICMGSLTACGNGNDANIPEDKYRTFYEVFVYSFYDGDGDGIGDLNGLTQKLDYINDGDSSTDTDLGCDGIWLMPVMPSATYHKYDVTDYYGIDKEYGTMEDFENFMAASKEKGIRVIMDLVINHTSSEHPWFTKAAQYLKELGGKEPSAEECPYFDYYNFTKEGGAGYQELPGTEWYYEAQFWSGMPDLNLGSESVRKEIEDIVDFWFDKGVDGFRLDAAKEYYSGTTDANIDVLTWFNQMVKEKKEDAYIVAEVWTDMDTYAQYYKSGIDSVFNFAFADSTGIIANTVKGSSPASGYGKAVQTIEGKFGEYNPEYIDAPFYTNHDLARSAGYYSGENSEKQTKMAGALNLLMSGSAYLYYGEELGMKGSGKDENKRAPMYWSKDSGAAGMCSGPEDMDKVKMKYDSLEEQRGDENSVYHYYKDVIKLRNTYPEIARGAATYAEELSNEDVCVIKKACEGSESLLVMNISAEAKEVELNGMIVNGEEIKGKKSLEKMLLTGEEQIEAEGTTVILPPYSIAVFR